MGTGIMKRKFILFIFFLGFIGAASPLQAATTITPSSGAISPNAALGMAYTSTTTIVASGGVVNNRKPYTWSSSGLPAGLTLTTSGTYNANCKITGTPTVSGTNLPFTITVKDKKNVAATGSYTITITAGVSCSFVGGSTGSISFGGIDPTSVGTVTGAVISPQFTCTPAGTAYTITVNPAAGWQLSSGANTLGYTLGTAASGTYAGSAVSVFTGSGSTITQGQYVNAPAGTYTNGSAVNVTIGYSGGTLVASLPINSVTGTVQSSCAVTGSSSLIFGTVDAVTYAGGASATVTTSAIKCTMGSSVTVTSDGGLNYSGTPRLKNAATDYINYNISFNSPITGAGGATNISGNLALSAAIPAGALDNAPAGLYNDMLTLTVSY